MLPLIVLPLTVRVPTVQIPPPSVAAVFPSTVEPFSTTVTFGLLTMIPPPPPFVVLLLTLLPFSVSDAPNPFHIAPSNSLKLFVTVVLVSVSIPRFAVAPEPEFGAMLPLSSQSVSVITPPNQLEIAPAPNPPTATDADGSGDLSAGDTISYTFTATNTGGSSLTNVTIVDPLPGLSALSCTPTQPATLTPGAMLVCTATYIITAGNVTASSINNTATADSNQTDAVMDSETVPLPGPALSLDKMFDGFGAAIDANGSGDLSAGDTISYTFTATNTGTANLTNVTIVDPLPGLSALGCVPAQPATLMPTDTLVCTATYVITPGDVAAGQIGNLATADSDQTAPVMDPETVPLPQPALSLTKAFTGNADEDGSGTVTLNDTLTYTFTATNIGTANRTGVTITDPLPGLSALNCTPAQPATLAPAASLVCTATYVVTAADVAASSIVNTATADSDQTPPVQDPEIVPIGAPPPPPPPPPPPDPPPPDPDPPVVEDPVSDDPIPEDPPEDPEPPVDEEPVEVPPVVEDPVGDEPLPEEPAEEPFDPCSVPQTVAGSATQSAGGEPPPECPEPPDALPNTGSGGLAGSGSGGTSLLLLVLAGILGSAGIALVGTSFARRAP